MIRLLLFVLLSTTVFLWSCEKAEEAVQPGAKALAAEQVLKIKSATEKEDKDDKYKTDKTGQYVSKDVQVTGYEDGNERPTRPKYDMAAAVGAMVMPPDEPCPYSTDCTGGGGGTWTPPPPPTFVSSESIGEGSYYYNSRNLIQDLKIIKGSSSSIGTSDLPGYYKIPVDLNKGAGGKYIYLCFTREPNKVVGSDSWPNGWINDPIMGKYVPVKDIIVKSYTIGGVQGWPSINCTPPIEVKDAIGFHTPDLNDGAGGKYIYAYQNKCGSSPIVEVGVIYGNSSSIQPPSGWDKIPGDLNEGAGGEYIYFCVKR